MQIQKDLFGGKHSDQYNAFYIALQQIAIDHGVEPNIYNNPDIDAFMNKTSGHLLTALLVDELHRNGFQITRIK